MAEPEMINNAFWLKFAKDSVATAITSRDDAAIKLDTYLNIVWIIYTSAFAVGTAFNIVENDFWARIIMALPIIILPVARFFCMQVQLPVHVKMQTNEPADIEENGYKIILEGKNKRLHKAKIWSFISAFSIGIAVFIFKLHGASNEPVENPYKNFYVKAIYIKPCNSISINGYSQADKLLTLSIIGSDTANKTSSYKEFNKLKSDNIGKFDTIIENKGEETNFRVFVSWNDENNIIRTIKN